MDPRLERWIRETYRYRTQAIARGVVNVDWLDPRYRITVTEILARAQLLGLTIDALELRHWLAEHQGGY